MTSSTLKALEEIVAGTSTFKIRIDKATQQASILDVIRLVTGRSVKRASEVIINLGPELVEGVTKLRINGKGRPTPVCDDATMRLIIMALPGKRATSFQHQIVERLSRSETAWHELMVAGECSREENGVVVGAKRTTALPSKQDVERFMELKVPVDAPEEDDAPGFVYFVRMGDTDFVKVGYTRSADPRTRLSSLQTACPYELVMEQAVYVNEPAVVEKKVHLAIAEKHHRGEWFVVTTAEVATMAGMVVSDFSQL